MNKKLIILTILTFFTVSYSFAAEQSVTEIIDNIQKVYAQAQQYSDSGEVVTTYVLEGIPKKATRTFTTSFARPDRFRFEFKYHPDPVDPNWDRCVISQDGDKITMRRSDDKPNESSPSLDIAVATATGVSGGSSFYIPGLLLPDRMSGTKITNLQNAKVVGQENGMIHIQGLYSNTDVDLWIDAKNFLIKRIDIHLKAENFESTNSITYYPSLNPLDNDAHYDWLINKEGHLLSPSENINK